MATITEQLSGVGKKAKESLAQLKKKARGKSGLRTPKVDTPGEATARSEAEKRFKKTGVTSKPQTGLRGTAEKVGRGATTAVKRFGPGAAAGFVAEKIAAPLGEAVARQVTGIDVDPATGLPTPAGSPLQSLSKSFSERIQADIDAEKPRAGARTTPVAPVAAPAAPAAPAAGVQAFELGDPATAEAQGLRGTVSNIPGQPATVTPAVQPAPRAAQVSTAPTFGERQELRSARIGTTQLQSGFLTDEQKADQRAAAQSRLDVAQAAPGERVAAQTAAAGQEAGVQAAGLRAQGKAAAGAGLSFRDQMALYSQQYEEQRDLLGDDQKATSEVTKSIRKEFGEDTRGANLAIATIAASKDPEYNWDDNIGRAVRRDMKAEAVDESNENRWFYERMFNIGTLGAEEKFNLDFSGWDIDVESGDIINPEGNNASPDEFSREEDASAIVSMIMADKRKRAKKGAR